MTVLVPGHRADALARAGERRAGFLRAAPGGHQPQHKIGSMTHREGGILVMIVRESAIPRSYL